MHGNSYRLIRCTNYKFRISVWCKFYIHVHQNIHVAVGLAKEPSLLKAVRAKHRRSLHPGQVRTPPPRTIHVRGGKSRSREEGPGKSPHPHRRTRKPSRGEECAYSRETSRECSPLGWNSPTGVGATIPSRQPPAPSREASRERSDPDGSSQPCISGWLRGVSSSPEGVGWGSLPQVSFSQGFPLHRSPEPGLVNDVSPRCLLCLLSEADLDAPHPGQRMGQKRSFWPLQILYDCDQHKYMFYFWQKWSPYKSAPYKSAQQRSAIWSLHQEYETFRWIGSAIFMSPRLKVERHIAFGLFLCYYSSSSTHFVRTVSQRWLDRS
jgi:hypothetical protein